MLLIFAHDKLESRPLEFHAVAPRQQLWLVLMLQKLELVELSEGQELLPRLRDQRRKELLGGFFFKVRPLDCAIHDFIDNAPVPFRQLRVGVSDRILRKRRQYYACRAAGDG